jgi:hypothetical protein
MERDSVLNSFKAMRERRKMRRGCWKEKSKEKTVLGSLSGSS